MTSSTYEFEKYVCSPETLKEKISEFGVAIIPAVLNADECNGMIDGMWDTLEKWTKKWDVPINRSKRTSWRQMNDLFPLHSMLLQHYSVGHAQFVWDLRQNPKCIDIFSRFWECPIDDLLVSFDGVSFHMPSEVTKKGWQSVPNFHSDQSYTRNEFECIQSWVTAFDVNEGDATLMFLERSHQYHGEFSINFNMQNMADWTKLEAEEHFDFYRSRGCLEKCIKCPRGSMVFWDSRTIHCGIPPAKGRAESNFRCVVYLCYTPRLLASEAELQKKRRAFEEMRMTSHWPHKIRLFGLTPRSNGAEIKQVSALPLPVVNELGRRLAGF
jgi:hypothetical protein